MKTSESLLDRVRRIATPNDGLVDRDVLLTWDLSNDAIATLHDLAGALRAAALEGLSLRAFDTGLAVSIFRDKSTRTRYAFRAACNLLGLATEELDESTSQVAHGETARETAAMIGFFTEVVGVRDDLFLGEGHTGMQATAASLEESHRAGALLQRPSVLNLQCDLDHPTQSMADLAHLAHHFGGVERLQGKKLVMSWAHSPSYGKPLSVPQGIVALMTRFGMDVVLAHPEGYELEAGPLEAAQGFAAKSGGRFRVTHAMDEAFEGADVVYPKSWAPGWIMRERTKLHRGGAGAALADLETQALAQNARYASWECDEAKMARTRDGAALYMHCLPADISGVSCKSGEVSAAVFERARLDTYREASYKPYAIAAMILATRFPDPGAVLEAAIARGTPRRGAGEVP
ncbi:MAG: knotted carbamoyltransferase YgeW [Polyangiaceae bacterium]|jgi:knotted carbamoyltransferase YgeW|nr:knotted carbamoyltransferase YgeW [Polyangiaceae bacterium]MBK8938007.1 knotted carbamoyltransferase YgeW [Polyangiaceae bacterium]